MLDGQGLLEVLRRLLVFPCCQAMQGIGVLGRPILPRGKGGVGAGNRKRLGPRENRALDVFDLPVSPLGHENVDACGLGPAHHQFPGKVPEVLQAGVVGEQEFRQRIRHARVKPGQGEHVVFAGLDSQSLIDARRLSGGYVAVDHPVDGLSVSPDVFRQDIGGCAQSGRWSKGPES